MATIKQRSLTSKAYKDYQAAGVDVAELLNDRKHKALYIRLAKLHGSNKIRNLAKEVCDKPGVLNRGAYLMRLLQLEKENTKNNSNQNKTK